jgi:hypothetical protein
MIKKLTALEVPQNRPSCTCVPLYIKSVPLLTTIFMIVLGNETQILETRKTNN